MRVVVIGGSGVIGTELVRTLRERHDVLACGRSTCDFVVDIASTDSIRRLFEAIGRVDAVICAAGDVVFKPLDQLTDEDMPSGLPTN